MRMTLAVALLLAALPAAAYAAPCDGVSHSLNGVLTPELATILARQMNAQSLEVQGVLKEGQWTVLRVLPTHKEPAELFFSSDPLKNHYVYLWGGVVMDTDADEKSTQQGLLKNVPGIPSGLAACFAWYARHGFSWE